MKQLVIVLCILTVLPVSAQHAIVEESSTDISCEDATHATSRFKETVTILDEHAAGLANFTVSCSPVSKLTAFKGIVSDASGRVIRKMKQSELQRTEYSKYLAVDEYVMYLEYTPPSYPITITYEWTLDSRNSLIEFAPFAPQASYDVSVRYASYRLTVPKDMAVRHALQNIGVPVGEADAGKNARQLSIELRDLKPLRQEPLSRPLRERMPLAYFAPETFVYYGTTGCLSSWADYGRWEYSLIQGSDALPEDVCRELHQLTDHLGSDRAKVETLYKRLETTTRYVAILLGIGGQRPAPAQSVCRSGFGDCKGLTNYMRAMLKEVGIASRYTTISTTNRRLLPAFASVGQMNHVILQVPLPGDTLWIECTNPKLPLGYVHEDIAGHDAIVIDESGGRLVRLPVYADSLNLQRTTIDIAIESGGAADVSLSQTSSNQQYESHIPLLNMSEQELCNTLQRIVRIPQAEVSRIGVSDSAASITLSASVRSRQYATVTGQRLFVPLCPVHQGFSAPALTSERMEPLTLSRGYQDDDEITFTMPEGYEVEAMPNGVTLREPFGAFDCSLRVEGRKIHVRNRLLVRAGSYDKSLCPQFAAFLRAVANAYGQKVVLKKNCSGQVDIKKR